MSRYRQNRQGKARFVWDAQVGAYALNFDYDREFVALIKAFIPSSHRDYEPTTSTWYIKETYFEPFKTILEAHFGSNAYIVEKPPENAYTNIVATPIDTDLAIFAKIAEKPMEDIKGLALVDATKLYRSLALKFHPDRAPDKAHIMSELNSVWPRLKTEYFK